MSDIWPGMNPEDGEDSEEIEAIPLIETGCYWQGLGIMLEPTGLEPHDHAMAVQFRNWWTALEATLSAGSGKEADPERN